MSHKQEARRQNFGLVKTVFPARLEDGKGQQVAGSKTGRFT